MGKGYYAVLDKKDRVAYLVDSVSPGSAKRSLKSRLRKGFYRRSGKFHMFQRAYDEDSGRIDVEEMNVSIRVFAENELKSRGYRLLGDGDLDRPKGNVMVKVPGEYVGSVRGLVELLEGGYITVKEFGLYCDTVKG